MDYGEEAFEETINRLGGIHHVGAGDWENAYSPLILEQDDVTVAIFLWQNFNLEYCMSNMINI